MDKRLAFHEALTKITPNVYFQEPSNTSMKYPCIVYSRKNTSIKHANNMIYGSMIGYDVKVIDRNPNSGLANKLMSFEYSKFDRQYVNNGLNHISFVIYY